MINAIIVDDEKNNRQNLNSLLSKYCPQVNIVGEAISVESALQLIHKTSPKLVFLDIKMPNKDGFELLKSLPRINFEVIFVTAFNQFAIKAIKFSAIDYLLKPIDFTELVLAVEKASKRIEQTKQNDALENYLHNINPTNKTKRLALPTHEKITYADIDSIIRFEGDNNYTHVHFVNAPKQLVSKTLKEFEDLLVENGFLRIHRSHVINLKHIKAYLKNDGGYIQLVNDEIIPISRNKKSEILDRINRQI